MGTRSKRLVAGGKPRPRRIDPSFFKGLEPDHQARPRIVRRFLERRPNVNVSPRDVADEVLGGDVAEAHRLLKLLVNKGIADRADDLYWIK